MAKMLVFLLLLTHLTAGIRAVVGVEQSNNQTTTRLQFYVHNERGGPDPSTVEVARADRSVTKRYPSFGRVFISDDLVTEGADPNSGLLGISGGFYGLTDRNSVVNAITTTISFLNGPFAQSTISFMGLIPAASPNPEVAVVGGTGAFRLGRGSAVLRLVASKANANTYIYEYKVTVVH